MAFELPKLSAIPLQAPAGSNPQDAQSAISQINAQYAPQETTMQSVLDQISGALTRDSEAQQKYGEAADQKLLGIGQQLSQGLQVGADTTGKIYQQGAQQVGAGYDQGISQVQQAGGALSGFLQGNADKLGLGEALQSRNQFDINPLQRLMAENQGIQSRMQESKASTVGNLQALGTNLQGIAQQRVGDSEANFANKRADVQSQVVDNLTKIQQKSNLDMTGILQEYLQMGQQKGNDFAALLQQTAEARTAAERQAHLDAIDEFVKTAKVNTDQQRADANDANIQSQIGLRDITGAATQTKAAADAKIANPEFGFGSGVHGLNEWFKKNLAGPDGKQKHDYGYFKSAIRKIISDSENAPKEIDPVTGKPKTTFEMALATIMNDMNENNGNLGIDLSTGSKTNIKYFPGQEALDAIRTYFGKGGTATSTSGKKY